MARTSPDTWALAFNRAGFNNRKRSGDVWFVATQTGDRRHKSAVQQALLRVPPVNTVGLDQVITFDLPPVARSRQGGLPLMATSNRGLRVRYYVKQGPAVIDGDSLRFTRIPRSATRPVKVTVVAWQWGLAGKIRSAVPIERTIRLSD